jgi:hypothetical protein
MGPARAAFTVRCAIYTRKSSDEGLDQEFNSLDAQREACEAYIVSQRHAGWVALADMYDDGGLSAGICRATWSTKKKCNTANLLKPPGGRIPRYARNEAALHSA